MQVFRKLSRPGPLAFLILCLTLAGSFGTAANAGVLDVVVVDPSGARISGAVVILRTDAGAVASRGITGREGDLRTARLSPGRYWITAEAPGFSQRGRLEIEIAGQGPQSVEIEMIVAAISQEVVVTPTRTDTPASEHGGSVSVISESELVRANQNLVLEALRGLPGLTVVQSGGRGLITSIFVRGGESDYAKVLVDGVPVNAAGGSFDFGILTPENLDRIEVARGPRSALFGSDAMTGVIQLFTRQGVTSVPEVELSAEGGSFGLNRETARLSGAWNRFDYSTSFGYQSLNGRFENSDFINRSASANLGFAFSQMAGLRVTSRWNSAGVGVPGATAVLFPDPDQRQSHRDIATSALFDLNLNPRWRQTARFVYAEFNRLSVDPVAQDLTSPERLPLPPGAFGADFAFSFRDSQRRSGVQYQTIASLGERNVLTAGVDYEHQKGVFTDDFSRVSPNRNNLGVYVQDQATFRQRIFLTGGIRLERNSGRVPDDLRSALELLGSSVPEGDVGFGVKATPSLAVAIRARDDNDGAFAGATRIKASFGKGIKEPTLVEAFSPSIFFLGNPRLDPERSVSFDVGVQQEFLDRRAAVEATYFDNRFRDLIIFTFNPATFGPVRLADGALTNFVNFERASARGIELIGAVRPTFRLRLAGGYTFLQSRVERASESSRAEEGLPLPRRPRNSGSFEVEWIGDRFDARADAVFLGKRRDLDPVSFARFLSDGSPVLNKRYARVNLAGSIRATRGLRLFARVENLLNRDYEEVLGFPAYRLNFTAGVRVRLGGGR